MDPLTRLDEIKSFSFENALRNSTMEDKLQSSVKHTFTKTGTTIVGARFDQGIVLAADTRATAGHIVVDKNCEKIHFIAPKIYCCGAGTAADTEHVTEMVSSMLKLHTYRTGRESRVSSARQVLSDHLFRHQGHVSAALVLGGVDVQGPHLCCIFPHGSSDALPFVTMGSGSLAAMSVLERAYNPGMSREEAVALCIRAIEAGILNDMGSGSNVDVCIITADGVDFNRNVKLTGTESAAHPEIQ
eukprot:gnl/Dysnectes_brevis/1658_a1886_3029.p1 GENE.gnl/Dysnectes_brevis/1658_a1886_3029~~gnl/Dysnectes_brevis/1658_a1886_3029.p1  ORF type:complete len:251 (-),score=60.91 gnl/Dysnectes_brevis/1658_a1886_3029:62-793(-)